MSDPVELNTVVVGGGHCGLNLGCWLAEKGDKSYIVLERGEILNAWKHNRWDTFVMNTPMKYGSPKVRVGHCANLTRGGRSRILVQQSMIIPMSADAEWKP